MDDDLISVLHLILKKFFTIEINKHIALSISELLTKSKVQLDIFLIKKMTREVTIS